MVGEHHRPAWGDVEATEGVHVPRALSRPQATEGCHRAALEA